MPETAKPTISLPQQSERLEQDQVRRSIGGGKRGLNAALTHRDAILFVLLSASALLVLLPSYFLVVVPATLTYYLWATGKRYRLPFRIPITWGGKDPSEPKPGSSGFSPASGILYLGRDQGSGEELWVTNSDARRHGFFLGTTGSGKALPLDTPVLTASGWVLNRDLRSGDILVHPLGGSSRVTSVHPQGHVPAVRLSFADGRTAICSRDHLWRVSAEALPGRTLPPALGQDQTMTAADIGMLHGMYADRALTGAQRHLRLTIPLSTPTCGMPDTHPTPLLTPANAIFAAERGLDTLSGMPSTVGSVSARRQFLSAFLQHRGVASVQPNGIRIPVTGNQDAYLLKNIVWSLGGLATQFIRADRDEVLANLPDLAALWPDAAECAFPDPVGLEITAIEPLSDRLEMSCIKTDRDDGLYVMEGHVVTHNTELLLGIISQTLTWSSGFLFVDGKGTRSFYARVWSLAKRFGREDDVRVLDFTGARGDPDAPAGGPHKQTNTVNPFAKGSPDQLMNLIVSLMGDTGQGQDVWKSRAMALVTSAMKALCELRDQGDILLDVQAIRDFLPLGQGIKKPLLQGRKVTDISEIPEAAWAEMRTRCGMIELYLRALNGDFSNAGRDALKGFFDTLPGFSVDKAMNGDPQDAKASEQYGFLSMQLTKPLGSLADDFGHLFRTSLGEVDIADVVLNRRILVVLLPALQKAPEEMANCGKIIIAMTKMMMGEVAAGPLQGTKRVVIDAAQTTAPSPYVIVLDEVGYYMVKGIDVMMAQARSLGFMIVLAGQDMAAMQSINDKIPETAAANASLFAAGKAVDGGKTLEFIQRVFGRAQIAVSSGYTAKPGLFAQKWVDRMDTSFQEVDRAKVQDLQSMQPGEFYFLFDGVLVRANTFYIGEEYAAEFSVNKFLKVRGPTDREPGLDQSVEIAWLDDYLSIGKRLLSFQGNLADLPDGSLNDPLSQMGGTLERILEDHPNPSASLIRDASLVAILATPSATSPPQLNAQAASFDDLPEGLLEDPTDPDLPEPHLNVGQTAADPLDEAFGQTVFGQTPRERHAGIVGMMIEEQQARKLADEAGEAWEDPAAQPGPEADMPGPESMRGLVGDLAAGVDALQRIFSAVDQGRNLGDEILARAAELRPTPLPKTVDPHRITSTLERLEDIVLDDSKT